MIACVTKVIFPLTIFFAISRPSEARESATYDLVYGFGSVLAAEEFCGFDYNQEAIREFIERRAPKEDLTFGEDVANHTNSVRQGFSDMTPSSKTAFCVQTGRVAKQYGFMR